MENVHPSVRYRQIFVANLLNYTKGNDVLQCNLITQHRCMYKMYNKIIINSLIYVIKQLDYQKIYSINSTNTQYNVPVTFNEFVHTAVYISVDFSCNLFCNF